MSEVQVTLDSDAVGPGGTVGGKVDWSQSGKRSERVAIRLFWFTQGKGTEDLEIVEEKIVESPSASSSEVFSFKAPRFPYSYAGKLLAITWAVEASLEPKGEVDRKQFTLGPQGREIRL